MISSGATVSADATLQNVSFSDAALTLTWDEATSTLPGELLRAACRCAQCRFERHKAGVSIDAALPVADGVTIVGVASMGYGLQIKFSDGHDRGIFPLAYLRELVMGTSAE